MDYYGSTALSVAVRCGSNDMVKRLLAISDTNVFSEDKFGRTPLLWAQKQGNTYIAECLLEHARCRGLDISKTGNVDQMPAKFNRLRRCCDVCLASTRHMYYYSKSCDCRNFDICLECHQLGARCLVESHKL